jgi:hypothetical protein
MRARSFLILAAAMSFAAPAAAELPVSPLPDIYLSFNDCLEAAQKDGLSKDKLTSLGWSRATMTKPDGTPIANGPIIYGNAKRKPVIMLSAESGEGVCIVMARIEARSTFPQFLKAWGPGLPAPDKDGAISFSDEGHIVQIRQTGTDAEPALTMTVMTPLEKK